jgi:hypothetical protein
MKASQGRAKVESKMDQFKKAFLNVRESVVRLRRAQTMTEYALVAWGAYNHVGHDIGSMASGIDSNLTNA